MNGMRRKIAGKTPAEIREMSKDEMKEPITMEDFIQVMLEDLYAMIVSFTASPKTNPLYLGNRAVKVFICKQSLLPRV